MRRLALAVSILAILLSAGIAPPSALAAAICHASAGPLQAAIGIRGGR